MSRPATPWKVTTFPNGEPFISDASGYQICQVAGTIRYAPPPHGDYYIVRNRENAELICKAVNAMFPP